MIVNGWFMKTTKKLKNKKMSTRKTTSVLRITNTVAFAIIIFLLVRLSNLSSQNYKLEEEIKKENMQHSGIIDQYIDLQDEYAKAFDELLKYENSADSTRQ